MPMFRKTGCAALVACCMAVGATGAQAALVNFTLTGDVNLYAAPGNIFGMNTDDDIIVTGTFDDSALSSGSGTVSFAQGSGNVFSLAFSGFTLTEQGDRNYTTGYPQLALAGGSLVGFNYIAQFGGLDAHVFDSHDIFFDGYEYGGDQTVSGTWLSFEMTPVPVPAAVWLLGSGLIGLAGIAKRKRVA